MKINVSGEGCISVPNIPLYTMIRCNNQSLSYGHTHGSDDTEITICGINIVDDKWIITHNKHDGRISCPKCLKKIK